MTAQADLAEQEPGMEVPPDAKALVGVILAEATPVQASTLDEFASMTGRKLGTINGLAERLAVLLEAKDAEREERDKATEIALLVLNKAIGGLEGTQAMHATPLPSIAALIEEAETALARLKEAPNG